MSTELLPARKGSVLESWTEDGTRFAPSHSNVATIVEPTGERAVVLEVDEPVDGWLVRLRRGSPPNHSVIARYITEDHAHAVDVAHDFALYASRYDQLDRRDP